MQGYYENHRDGMAHAHAWYTRDDHCSPHFHNSVELVYVLDGALRATLNGVAHTVSAGTVLISSSYTIHGYETPESCRAIIVIIPMTEVPSVRQLLSTQAFSTCICPDDEAATLRTLMTLMAEHGDRQPLTMKGLCYAVLGLLIDRVGLVEVRQSSQTAFIRDVLDYLQQHHAEPLNVQRVADRFGYSRSRFSRIFSENLGCTLCEYINAVRCRHAAQLLREEDLPVSEVAMRVGFESLRTFYRTFKTQYEMTPNAYARAHLT